MLAYDEDGQVVALVCCSEQEAQSILSELGVCIVVQDDD